MVEITARLPDDLVEEIDRAATRLRHSRAQVLRLAVESYLDDLEDLTVGIERLQDPADPVLEWGAVRRALLDQDQG